MRNRFHPNAFENILNNGEKLLGSKALRLTAILFLLNCLCIVSHVWGQSVAGNATEQEELSAEALWARVESARQPYRPSKSETSSPSPTSYDEFQRILAGRADWAVRWSDAAREFYFRFPNHPLSERARIEQFFALRRAAALGATGLDIPCASIEEALGSAEPKSLNEFNLRWELLIRTAVEAVASNGESAALNLLVNGGYALRREFPSRPECDELLLSAAGHLDAGTAARIAHDVLENPASARTKDRVRGMAMRIVARHRPLDAQFTDIDGHTINLSEHRGKPILLHFWSSASGTVQQHLNSVKTTFENYRSDGLEVIGINFDPAADLIREHIARSHILWPQVLITESRARPPWLDYGISSLPSVWLLDRNGRVIEINPGDSLNEKLQAIISGE